MDRDHLNAEQVKAALQWTADMKARMAADEAKLDALLRDLKQLRKEMTS